MLGLGWTEMLVIGVAALIFIGPKDLPVVMKRLGQLTGQIRRMGNEFQREINKTTGLDEVRNLRNAITAPLKQTTDQIRRDFNAMTPTGEVKPSGLIKPADPKAESVVDEIHAAAGMKPPVKAAVTPRKAPRKKPAAKAKTAAAKPAAATPAKKAARKPAASAARPAAASKAKAAPAPVVAAEPAVAKPAPKKHAAAAKPRTAKSPAAKTARAKPPTTKAPAAKAGTE